LGWRGLAVQSNCCENADEIAVDSTVPGEFVVESVAESAVRMAGAARPQSMG